MERQARSAGGILLKRQNDSTLVAIVERHRDVEAKWLPVLRQLPKGGIEGDESVAAAALREVEEETGFVSTLIAQAGTASWSYLRAAEIWHETVTYFFLEPRSESPHALDGEFDLVSWIPIEDVPLYLSYPEERELIREILSSRSLPTGY
jgi:8-oxo-dGTP pyrophosphatase MutT (NUDIX family)